MKKSDKRFVLWSGGLDSTYLIWNLLQTGHEVRAAYVELVNNEVKTKMEKAAIEKMLPFFSAYNFSYCGVLLKTEVNPIDQDVMHFHQMPIWLLAASLMESPVSIGYVRNDDAISWIPEMHRMAKAYSGLRKLPLKLEFPLCKIGKEEIWENIPEELRKHVVWCEMPTESFDQFRPCGHCHACLRSMTYKKIQSSEVKECPQISQTDSSSSQQP